MYLKKITLSISIIFTFIISTSFTENNELETKVLFEDKVEIKIPKNWKLKEVSETIDSYKSEIAFESEDGQLFINLKQHHATKEKPGDLVLQKRDRHLKFTQETFDFKLFYSGYKKVNERRVYYYEGEMDDRTYLLDFYTFFDGKIFQTTFFALSYKDYNPEAIKKLALKILESLKIKTTDISLVCAEDLYSKSMELEEKVLSALTSESFDVTYSVKRGSETSSNRQTFYKTNMKLEVPGIGSFGVAYDKANNICAIYKMVNKIMDIRQFDNFGVLAFFVDKDIRYNTCMYDIKEKYMLEKNYINLHIRDSGTDKILSEEVYMRYYLLNNL